MTGIRPRTLSVLLVEDSRLLTERLRETIAAAGAQLAGSVDTEAAAVASLKHRPIDVVLLDLHLRGGTGFGVLRSINDGGVGKVVPIVLTNHDLGEYRRAAAALGARYFLDKLRDFERLPEILGQVGAEFDSTPSEQATLSEEAKPGEPSNARGSELTRAAGLSC